MKFRYLIAIAALTNASCYGVVIVGSDFADDAAYNGGWTNGTDGGTAGTFGAWTLTITGGTAGHFIGSSTTLASPGADINTGGESFGMFGHTGQTSEAFRNFNGNSLGAGQTFSLDLAVNFRNGNKGFDLRNSANSVIFNFNIGSDAYVVNNAATGNGTIGTNGNLYSDNTEFRLSFTQTDALGGTWTITRSGGVTDSDSGTYSGIAENFKFYEAASTVGGIDEDNLFINNLTVVPEPASAALGLIGATLLLRRRRI